MPLPGWYPDPTGDYELRYWDGSAWTDRAVSFGAEFLDPPAPPGLPEVEVELWRGGPNVLTTHRAWIEDGFVRGRVREVALWMVRDVEVMAKPGQALRGTGRVSFHIAYPGYAGRSHLVMKGVGAPHEVAALGRKWAHRNRKYYSGA